jgi:hypothetical protein
MNLVDFMLMPAEEDAFVAKNWMRRSCPLQTPSPSCLIFGSIEVVATLSCFFITSHFISERTLTFILRAVDGDG